MNWMIVVLVIVAIVVVVAVAMQMRSARLKRRFGPEYEHTVEETGNRRTAEAELRARAKRRAEVELRELSPEALADYRDRWHDVQAEFVDDPRGAVGHADALVEEVMRDRGYPIDGFDAGVDMVSVDHPDLAETYRAAHAIGQRSAQEASLDDLREAMQHYHVLFDELLGEPEPGSDIDPDAEPEPDFESESESESESDSDAEHDVDDSTSTEERSL